MGGGVYKMSFALKVQRYIRALGGGATPSELWSKVLRDNRPRQNTRAPHKHSVEIINVPMCIPVRRWVIT